MVLPAPLRPTRPTLSPGPIRNDASSTRMRAPARTCRWWAVIIGRVFRGRGRRVAASGCGCAAAGTAVGSRHHGMQGSPSGGTRAEVQPQGQDRRPARSTIAVAAGGTRRLPAARWRLRRWRPGCRSRRAGRDRRHRHRGHHPGHRARAVRRRTSSGGQQRAAPAATRSPTARPVRDGAETDPGLPLILVVSTRSEASGRRRCRSRPGSSTRTPSCVSFSGSTSSGCGQASSAMGPFYCPADKYVYLDPTFFDDMLAEAARRRGRRLRRGVRRSPTSTATTSRTCSAPMAKEPEPRDRPDEPVGRARAAGRLLRGRLGARRDDGRGRGRRSLHHRDHRRRHPDAHRRSHGRRRRPDPAADPGPRQRGAVDPRLGGGAGPLVHPGLPGRHPRLLRHLLGQLAVGVTAATCRRQTPGPSLPRRPRRRARRASGRR